MGWGELLKNGSLLDSDFCPPIPRTPPSPQIYANINTVQVATALGWLIVGGPTQRLVPGDKWMMLVVVG